METVKQNRTTTKGEKMAYSIYALADRGRNGVKMKDATVSITTIKFSSPTGECSPELETALANLTKTIEYHARKISAAYHLKLEIEEN